MFHLVMQLPLLSSVGCFAIHPVATCLVSTASNYLINNASVDLLLQLLFEHLQNGRIPHMPDMLTKQPLRPTQLLSACLASTT